ncbi:MAG: hypothetical protein SGJ04_01170 [Bacteroidota bacterium]|nr:hypothetical protein [Bacteroidota bacterium]
MKNFSWKRLDINIPIDFPDIKDPSIVFDGNMWHIYGTGGIPGDLSYAVVHFESVNLEGPYKLSSKVKA